MFLEPEHSLEQLTKMPLDPKLGPWLIQWINLVNPEIQDIQPTIVCLLVESKAKLLIKELHNYGGLFTSCLVSDPNPKRQIKRLLTRIEQSTKFQKKIKCRT